MNGVDNNRRVDSNPAYRGESNLDHSAANEGSIPPTVEKANLVFQQRSPQAPKAHIPTPAPLKVAIALVKTAQHCKKNRDDHLGNEGNPAPSQGAINPDRSKMGFLHRLGFVSLKKEITTIGGKEVEVALYPRMNSTKSQVEIVKGPEELVGLKVDGLNCHEPGWQQKAFKTLDARAHAQQQSSKTMPIRPIKKNADPVSTTSTNQPRAPDQVVQTQQQGVNTASSANVSAPPIQSIVDPVSTTLTNQPRKLDQVQTQQGVDDLTAVHLDFVAPDLSTASTTVINKPSSEPVPSSTSKQWKTPVIDSIDPTDITKSAEAEKLLQNIQETRMRKNKIQANPRASRQEKEQANLDYSDAIDQNLEFIYAGQDPLRSPTEPLRGLDILAEQLKGIERRGLESSKMGSNQIKTARQNRQDAARMQKNSDLLQKLLTDNPNASEITVKTQSGLRTFKRADALKKMTTLGHKAQARREDSYYNLRDGVKQIPSAVKGKMAGELKRQTKHMKGQAKTNGAVYLTDALLDLAEGKCNVEEALKKTVVNTVRGTAEQAATSVVFEGIKESVTTFNKDWAEKIPGLGTTVLACNALSTFNNSETAMEGLKNVANMGVDYGGEMAMYAAITACTGGTGIPVIVGSKIAWRATKMFWNWGTGK